MKAVRFLKTVVFAASLATGAAAHAAVGDIYEIRPCNEQGVSVGAYATATNTMPAGSNIYFNVRLVQRTIGDPWKLRYTGYGEELLDYATSPLEIGIYVSGQLRFAKLHDVKETYAAQGYTDLIFTYTTMPGDFALPIVLATMNGSVNYTGVVDESYEYLMLNTDKWAVVNDAGKTCNFWFTGSVAGRATMRPEMDSPKKDYTLKGCGFYVKTIDFDDNWESTSFWRTVKAGTRITGGATPSLVADSAPINAVTLYVWSTDTNAVSIAGGTPVELVSDFEDGNPVYLNTRMGTVTLAGGQVSSNFEIEGVTEGESCNLVLSMWPRYNFNASYVRKNDYLTVPVKCVELKTITITADKSVYNEGEAVQFTIQLSTINDTDAPLYAFLVAGPASTATEAKFDYSNHRCVITDDILSDPTKLQMTDGILIPPYTNGPGSPEEIYLLDGGGSGSSYYFSVKLCTTPQYDPNTVVSGYNSTYANIKVKNVEPVIKRIKMNGNPSESSGYAFPNKVPKGSEQSFEAIVDDPGEYDLEDGFQYKWTVSLAGFGVVSNATFTAGGGNQNNKFTYNFPNAGDWTIKLQVKDKDMKDWAAVTYTVGVSALGNPDVEIEAPAYVSETDRSTALTFYLSYWDPLYSGDLRLKITVKDWVEGKVNPGKLILDSTFASADPNEKGVYYVTVNNTLPMNIVIEDADGTTASSTTGFRVRAEVVGSPDNPNFVLPTSNSPAKDYYLPREVRVLVDNAMPVIDVSPEANTTNEWTVTGGGVDFWHPLRWRIRSDVDADFEDQWPKIPTNGVRVAFTGCDNETVLYVTEPSSGVFYPEFGYYGKRNVTLTIEDKDGGYETFTWRYNVIPNNNSYKLAPGVTSASGVYALSADGAIAAVMFTPPAGSIIEDADDYKALFDIAANNNGDGTYDVAITGIKPKFEKRVNRSAVENLISAVQSDDEKTVSVAVPAGLYYRVTTFDALGGKVVGVKSGLSTGATAPVDKPKSANAGFIKVEMGTSPFID